MDKTCVFVDGGFMANLTKYIFPNDDGTPRKLDLHIFSKFLSEDNEGELLRTYFYHCPPYQSSYPTHDEKLRKQNYDLWISSLRKLRKMQVREGRLRKYYTHDGNPDFVQKGVDVLLAIDMLKLAMKGAMDKIILLSSDSDFVPVVRALRDEGMSVILYYYKDPDGDTTKDCFSYHLHDECDERKTLTKEMFERATIKAEQKKRQRRGRSPA